MGSAFFYHLTFRPIEATLPMLLDRSLQAGWRVAVRGSDLGRLEWLDQKLWHGPETGFLPHGLAGGAHDALQPILLTTGPAANDPQCVICVDGASVDADEVKVLERVSILFDGSDAQAVQQARVQWKTLTDAGCTAQYWSEESGKWEKKAEK